MLPLLLGTVAPGAEVATDGAKTYFGLERCGYDHKVVNHRKEFVTKEGVHTNGIECYWRVLKGVVKAWWDRQPSCKNYQMAHFAANCGLKKIDEFAAFLVLLRWRCALLSAKPKTYEALVESAIELLASFKNPDEEEERVLRLPSQDDVPLGQLSNDSHHD